MQMISAEKLDLIRKFENWKFRIVEIDEKCTFTWNLAQLLIKCQRIAQIIATEKLEENLIMKNIKMNQNYENQLNKLSLEKLIWLVLWNVFVR